MIFEPFDYDPLRRRYGRVLLSRPVAVEHRNLNYIDINKKDAQTLLELISGNVGIITKGWYGVIDENCEFGRVDAFFIRKLTKESKGYEGITHNAIRCDFSKGSFMFYCLPFRGKAGCIKEMQNYLSNRS